MKGFTFLEILVVIIIIGILATFGISQYVPARERAFSREATANLRLIRAAERIYHMETDGYCTDTSVPACNNVGAINTNLKLSLTPTNWAYAITGGAAIFTATADRVGAGGYLNCQWSITLATDDPFVSTTPCMQ